MRQGVHSSNANKRTTRVSTDRRLWGRRGGVAQRRTVPIRGSTECIRSIWKRGLYISHRFFIWHEHLIPVSSLINVLIIVYHSWSRNTGSWCWSYPSPLPEIDTRSWISRKLYPYHVSYGSFRDYDIMPTARIFKCIQLFTCSKYTRSDVNNSSRHLTYPGDDVSNNPRRHLTCHAVHWRWREQ